jgi:uncharacterized protein YkwD
LKTTLLLAAAWLGLSLVSDSAVAQTNDLRTMHDLINQARARGANCGGRWYGPAAPLRLHSGLSSAANRWARYMLRAGKFAHAHSGSTFVKRIIAVCGRTFMGENLSGNRFASGAVRSLLRSPVHCRNIMNPRFRLIGLGTARGGRYGAYWVQKFASRC